MDYDRFRKKLSWLFDAALDNVTINRLYEGMIQRGWNYAVYDRLFFRRQHEYERLHPTEDMKACEAFFDAHRKDIQDCTELLSDTLSKTVYSQILKFRCTHDLKDFPPHDVTDQYFPRDIVRLSENEVLIDCGACRGDTYRRFQKESGGKYKGVVCFETEPKNVAFIRKSSGGDSRLTVIPKGAWSTDTVLRFDKVGLDWNGRFLQDGEEPLGEVTELPVTSIDRQECCREATYIKMDIEGSEWEALHGAENTIRSNHPKLAVCLYHSPQDYIRLIQYIHELNPDYRLYVRHHSTLCWETVLYAVEP